MSDLVLAERHRREQLAIRADLLRTFVGLFRVLSLTGPRTARPGSTRSR